LRYPLFIVGLIGLSGLTFDLPSLADSAKQSSPKSGPLVQYALARAREQGQKAEWKGQDNFLAATKYIEVTLGAKDFIYSREVRLIKTGTAPHPSAGIMGRWAEVGWDYLDKNMKTFSDTFGHYVLRSSGGKWKLEASGGTDGYDRDKALKNAGIPERIMKRLKYR
jgi:hypothetical protein